MDNATATVAALKAGTTTQRAILNTLEERRQTLEPRIRAFIHAADISDGCAIDTPLAGLPITVKDQIRVEGMPCTFGLRQNRPEFPQKTASAVQRLVDAGATVIGKTSLPPLAMDFQTCNDMVGTTANPWNPAYTAGGSSGGGAAAVASGMSLADIGADLAGSLRLPSAFCGVYSLLPGAGALPGDGMLQEDGACLRHFARMGPIARCVEDLQLLWKHMRGDERSAACEEQVDVIRLAVSDGAPTLPVEKRIARVFGAAAAAFQAGGVRVTKTLPGGLLGTESWNAYGTIMGHETGALMNPLVRLLVRISGRGAARRSPRFLGPVHEGYRRRKTAYEQALQVQKAVAASVSDFLEDHDALLLPVSCVGAFEHREPTSATGPVRDYAEPFDVDGTPLSYLDALTAFATPVSLAGNPVVTMPLGLDERGLPVGAQLIGRTGGEMQLLEIARQLVSMLPQIAAPAIADKSGVSP